MELVIIGAVLIRTVLCMRSLSPSKKPGS